MGGRTLASLTLACLVACSAADKAPNPEVGAGLDSAATNSGSGTPAPAPPKALDFDAHLIELQKRLPSEDFHHIVQSPFVVIGDGPKEMVELTSRRTVKWAVDLLKKDFFPQDPDHIIDVWLFKDRESYLKHNLLLWNEVPSTPFGYYSSANRVLVMNIATGGGTLVHEIVHPFMAANFEACPSWFNEGLASLYEQCRERDGKIMGLVNWRLDGLQDAIKEGTLPTFEELLATSDYEFYEGAHSGTNYGQARYLCYYLQSQGLLRKFYKEFAANADKDPTGVATLRKVLGRDDLIAFQKDWEAFISILRFE